MARAAQRRLGRREPAGTGGPWPRHELNVVCAWSEEDFLATLTGELAGEAAIHFGEILLLESWRAGPHRPRPVPAPPASTCSASPPLWRVAEATEDLRASSAPVRPRRHPAPACAPTASTSGWSSAPPARSSPLLGAAPTTPNGADQVGWDLVPEPAGR